ncbi:MAG TPA: TlpA disulfide reductase family protein [Opitutus sp.]|nr:TlpA disulfide reductase family protein [Opitutus sp.]
MWFPEKVFTFAAVLAALAAGPLHGQVAVGDPFPSLARAGLAKAELPELHGRVVLVDFWASWCAPCKASFPAMARLQAEFAQRGLVIVAVSVDEVERAYAAFLRKMAPPFVAPRDASQALVRAVKVPAMPTSYLLDRSGRVRFVHAGFHGRATEDELRAQIDALLKETG